MPVTEWDYETGANGATVTATEASTVPAPVTAGGTMVMGTAQFAHGTKSVHANGTTASGGVYVTDTIATNQMAISHAFKLVAKPQISGQADTAVETQVLWLGVSSTRSVGLAITGERKIRIRDAAGGGGAAIYTSTGVLALDTWYRLALFATVGSSTGTVRAAAFLADSNTPVSGMDSTLLTGRNIGATAFSHWRAGPKCTTTATVFDVWMDSRQLDPAATNLTAPYGVVGPTGSLITYEGYAVINATGLTPAVGPNSYAISPTTGVLEPIPGFFFAPQENYTAQAYNVTVTDDGNAGSTVLSYTVPARYASPQNHSKRVRRVAGAWV